MTVFTYTKDRPNPPNNPSSDVPDMQINCNSIFNLIDVDHNSFNANDGGFHKVIHFENQTIDPPNVPLVGQLYTKNAGTPATPALFYRPPGAAGGFQLTNFLTPSATANGFTFIPGGIILQWGNFNPNISTTVSFPITFPTAVFNLQLTGSAANNSTFRNGVSTGTLNASGFVWEGTISVNWTPIYWFAIGN